MNDFDFIKPVFVLVLGILIGRFLTIRKDR